MDFNLLIVKRYLPLFISGFVNTLKVSTVSLVFALVIGLIAGVGQISNKKAIKRISLIYINAIRCTPLLAQLYLVFFGLPYLGIRLSAYVTGVIALTLNSGAYIAEIIRSGIQAIPKGQTEAAYSMGMKYFTMMRLIILPQAFIIIIPPLVSQLVILIKDSALLSIVAYSELTRTAQIIAADSFSPSEGYLTSAVLYFVICYVIMIFSKYLESKKKNKIY